MSLCHINKLDARPASHTSLNTQYHCEPYKYVQWKTCSDRDTIGALNKLTSTGFVYHTSSGTNTYFADRPVFFTVTEMVLMPPTRQALQSKTQRPDDENEFWRSCWTPTVVMSYVSAMSEKTRFGSIRNAFHGAPTRT